ncbi:MAG TPA: type II toxin-antitoxin system YafQ family toxin [Rhabdochlamydiaceae bacterium]|nr:type II toxin-antitoxin system YafQ family toxin [Rhabdochlamydiaceae bacterium]
MFCIVISKQFKKDQKKLMKQRKNLERLRKVLELLEQNKQLPAVYKDHPLHGELNGYRDCHIEGDLVLIYKIDRKEKMLLLQRIGTHSELF